MLATSFPSYSHDYTKGSIGQLFNGKKTISGDSLMYIQGMAGPNIKFELPYLKKQLGASAINRAELEFTLLEEATEKYPNGTDKYPPIERFFLTTANGVSVADVRRSVSGPAEFGGTIVTEAGNLRRYKCNITQHLGNMLNGTAGTILYLVPDNTRGVSTISPNKPETTRRVVLYGTKNAKYKSKLNLYYTKP